MNIDLTQYVVDSWGPWKDDKEAFSPNELKLGGPDDGVALAGPLRVRVAVQALNNLTLYDRTPVLQARDIFSYTLDIAPGQTWAYPAPRRLKAPRPPRDVRIAATTAAGEARTSVATEPDFTNPLRREILRGSNAGFGIVVRPAGPDMCADPCAPDPCRPVDPCAPKKECHCGGKCGGGCGGEEQGDELPCDFATGSGSRLGTFFPAACEPCAPGAFIGMPPMKGPSLMVPAARGGTVRTRYFNGMFITKEDLWTDQNNNRIKHALMNRAMGQGVVWGFDLCLDGDAVCVLPGYGVDCCGNDIIVSSAYRVAAEALLRDPAAADTLAKKGAQRMNLLLEYFECPEEPRPVHGDPCSPESSSCETSRIRETARLRLIPPCDVDDSGPVKDFLDEMRKLKGDRIAGPILTGHLASPAISTAAPTPAAVTAVATSVPFQILVDSGSEQATIVPIPGQMISRTIKSDFQKPVRVEIKAIGATFGSGRVELVDPVQQTVIASIGQTGSNWTTDPFVNEVQISLVYEFLDWRATQGTSEYVGRTPTRIVLIRERPTKEVVTIQVTGEADVIVSEPPPPRYPCLSERCDPEGRPRFPIAIPWLHEIPGRPRQAADPKVIVAAVMYAMFATTIVQNGPATAPRVLAGQLELAKALNAIAWKLFYDDPPADERLQLLDALRRLLQALCKSLLYPGPRCECGCDPHGVIVGCALVEGGALKWIDPWGGRRWVVHYPLLSYWGKQFGIQPLDALASKFFDLICCLSGLPPVRPSEPPPPVGVVPAIARPIETVKGRTPVVELGAGRLIFGSPDETAARLKELGIRPQLSMNLSPYDFISRAVSALSTPSVAPGAVPLVDYSVIGVPEIHLITPAEIPVGGPLAAPSVGAVGRLENLVHSAFESRPARSAVPPLLRDFSMELATSLADAVPLQPSTKAGHAVRTALAEAGVGTVGVLLDRNPEDLHVNVLKRANPVGLTELLDSGEKSVATVAKAVADVVQRFASEKGLASRDDLRDPALREEFQKALVESLKGMVPPEAVAAATARTAGLR